MPELPEAETIARTLAPLVEGRSILNAEFPGRRVLRGLMPDLAGARILRVERHGKRIVLSLDHGSVLVSLGMTGALLVDSPPGPYTRAIFTLSGSTLLFDDIRQFGNLRFLAAADESLGPDPLEITAIDFTARLRARRTVAKRILLDQAFVRGLGNIYADEALHRARIHPTAATASMSHARAARLHAAIVELLNEAIAHRGSSISDYVDANGERGGFQLLHRVYRKQGQPCPTCGTPIQRIVLAQRGTHFCPRCQR
ncbi:MAG: bifunctional DNA-formamidopyrimidine glycosylase/DNA-(apurinic or apyrimidinic site) lyase [Acidobacteriota bacterium]